jgi:uncharacterized protein YfaS (alpha-2-macroglobulin family)
VAGATLLARGGPVALSVNDGPTVPGPAPVTLRPSLAQTAAGYRIRNVGTGPLFRSVTVHGDPIAAPPALAQGVTVTKTVTRMDGSPIDLAALTQNQRLVVHLAGAAKDDAYHQAILVDLLPAGWEIESIVPASTKTADNGMSWLGPLTRTDNAEKRDDRFVAALSLGGEQRYFAPYGDDDDDTASQKPADKRAFNLAYVVRAVTPGKFTLPEAVIEDMYRPQVVARTAAGTTEIAGKP